MELRHSLETRTLSHDRERVVCIARYVICVHLCLNMSDQKVNSLVAFSTGCLICPAHLTEYLVCVRVWVGENLLDFYLWGGLV